MTVVALIIAMPASDYHGGLPRGWSTAARAEVRVWFGSVPVGTNLCSY